MCGTARSCSTASVSAARAAQGSSGRELLDGALEALARSSGGDHQTLVVMLGSFRDPVLAEAAYDALFGDRSDARDGLGAM